MVALSTLAVDGAILAYQCSGAGPLLLTIPGANGDAIIFEEVLPYLAENFTVCSYDRRGFSNSTLTAPATAADLEMPYRLERDADDAAALLAHLSSNSSLASSSSSSGSNGTLVFGTSSGAIVGLELLLRHPAAVDLLIAHEPPLSYALATAEWGYGAPVEAVFVDIHQTYLAEGIDAAAAEFVGNASAEADPGVELERAWWALTDPGRVGNAELFFEAEIANYTAWAVNESFPALRALAGQVVFDIGAACVVPSCNISEALAGEVGVSLYTTPGGHLGYVSEPEGFSEEITSIFAENGRI